MLIGMERPFGRNELHQMLADHVFAINTGQKSAQRRPGVSREQRNLEQHIEIHLAHGARLFKALCIIHVPLRRLYW
jgi:hypothetical protein